MITGEIFLSLTEAPSKTISNIKSHGQGEEGLFMRLFQDELTMEYQGCQTEGAEVEPVEMPLKEEDQILPEDLEEEDLEEDMELVICQAMLPPPMEITESPKGEAEKPLISNKPEVHLWLPQMRFPLKLGQEMEIYPDDTLDFEEKLVSLQGEVQPSTASSGDMEGVIFMEPEGTSMERAAHEVEMVIPMDIAVHEAEIDGIKVAPTLKKEPSHMGVEVHSEAPVESRAEEGPQVEMGLEQVKDVPKDGSSVPEAPLFEVGEQEGNTQPTTENVFKEDAPSFKMKNEPLRDRDVEVALREPVEVTFGMESEAPEPMERTVPDSRLFQEMVEEFTTHRQDGRKVLRIKLQPEYLGEVEMRIWSRGKEISATIVTGTSEVRDLIEGQMNQLRQTLLEQDLLLNNVSVSLRGGPGSHLGQGGANGYGQRDYKTSGNSGAIQVAEVKRPGTNVRLDGGTLNLFA